MRETGGGKGPDGEAGGSAVRPTAGARAGPCSRTRAPGLRGGSSGGYHRFEGLNLVASKLRAGTGTTGPAHAPDLRTDRFGVPPSRPVGFPDTVR
ncbi:hypothetical protein Amsp01_066400 [Amycolatopsis sp. NBRC 101858]|nr:hypothetical protein Amsp01_066400 [Amycolatopsis sp. NBRC 101858]